MARADAPSGSAALNGTRTESWFVRKIYTDAPTGSVSIAGTRTESYVFRPAGRINISGAVIAESNRRSEAITGQNPELRLGG